MPALLLVLVLVLVAVRVRVRVLVAHPRCADLYRTAPPEAQGSLFETWR